MKEHTSEFKTQLKELGRQIRSQVIYGNTVLEEELFGVTPHYNGSMLKSTMKQLDIETSVNIPLMTEVEYKLGLLVNNNWEWLSFGKYYVYTTEKMEDKDHYKLVCYDKLLYSMIPYVGVIGNFPMTLRDYLGEICTILNITFASNGDEFCNYNREIPSDRYVGLSDYTYRDVLDEIAQATGSMICLNSDDELVVRYINEGIDNYNTVTGTSFYISDGDGGLSSSITKLEGNTTQEGTPTPSSPIEVSTVSGDNNIVVSNKNLFHDYATNTTPINGITRTKTEQGLVLDGTYNKAAAVDFWLTQSVSNSYTEDMALLKANTTYTLSIRVLSGSISGTLRNINLSTRNKDKTSFTWNYKNIGIRLIDNVEGKATFTTDNEEIYLAGIRTIFQTTDNVTFNNSLIAIQLEERKYCY